MKKRALTLQQLIALDDKGILELARQEHSKYKRLNNMRKLTHNEFIAYNRIQSILVLYKNTFSEEKACK